MKYNADDYEFAIRMLHHRQELTNKEVEEWMKEPEHLKLLEEMAAIRVVAGKGQAEDVGRARKRIRTGVRQRRVFRLAIGIAALVMVSFGMWHLLNHTKEQTLIPLATETRIEPGETKARLILPDGQVVQLASREQEIVVNGGETIRNDSLEGLKYEGKQGQAVKEEVHILQVPLGGFYKLELSDGTKVWLNAGSELRYPMAFSGSERRVFLKGEGYFEVAKDRQKPFHVAMERAEVTVLGTAFNISAYPEEKEILTTLVNGSVRFHSAEENANVTLTPGEQCVMETESGKTRVTKVDTELYTAWINGRFVFRDMPLEMIMRQLERWYDFQVTYVQPELKAEKFQGVIQRDTKIEDVFRAIELAMDVKFNINGKEVTIEKR